MSKDEINKRNSYGQAISLASYFIAGIAIFGYLGHLLDKKMEYENVFVIIGCMIGVLLGMYQAFKIAQQFSHEEK